jgi:hypothetical protein
MFTGCVALLVGQLCFAQDRITCSDAEIGAGIETCKAQFARMGFSMSSTGTAIVMTPGYYCGSHDCDLHAKPGIAPNQ